VKTFHTLGAAAVAACIALGPAFAQRGSRQDAADDIQSARELPPPPAPSPKALNPDQARYEAVFMKAEIYANGHVDGQVLMVPDMASCQSQAIGVDHMYSPESIQRAALTGNPYWPIAVVVRCFKNPAGGVCKRDVATGKLLGCYAK
jgi:hypothetical protein